MADVELIDGPLGIEGKHQWIDMGTATTLAVLGDYERGVVPVDPDPQYVIVDVVGLFDFEIEDRSEPKTEAIGSIGYPSRPNGNNITYTIDVRGSTRQLMRRGVVDLRQAFGPDITTGIPAERAMLITPFAAYGTAEHAYKAKCLQFAQGSDVQEFDERHMPTAWIRQVVIGLKRDDPRMYEWDPESEIGFDTAKW